MREHDGPWMIVLHQKIQTAWPIHETIDDALTEWAKDANVAPGKHVNILLVQAKSEASAFSSARGEWTEVTIPK